MGRKSVNKGGPNGLVKYMPNENKSHLPHPLFPLRASMVEDKNYTSDNSPLNLITEYCR
jgi:hypothetical protein